MYEAKWSYLLNIDASFVGIWCSRPKFPTFFSFFSELKRSTTQLFCVEIPKWKTMTILNVVKFKLCAIVARISMNKCLSFTASNEIWWFLFYFMVPSRMWIAMKILTQYAWIPNFKLRIFIYMCNVGVFQFLAQVKKFKI